MDLKKILLGVGRLKEEQKGGSLEMGVGKIGSRATEVEEWESRPICMGNQYQGQPEKRSACSGVWLSYTELAWKERHAVWPKHQL